MCQTCRTRWHEEPVCPKCVDESIADDEPSPRESQLQSKQAWVSVILGFVAWMALLMTLAPLSSFHQAPVRGIIVFMTFFLYFISFVPAVFGLGHAMSALRLRGDHAKLATTGLVTTGSQLGIAIGVLVLNIWHN
jgi:uncharacterized membrane protein